MIDFNKLKGAVPEIVFNALPNTCSKFNITTGLRLAHFLSQCAHESGNFKAVSENLNYSPDGLRRTFSKYFPTLESTVGYARNPEKIANKVYANRMGNGPEASGEGWKFRGKGYIQLTGKQNHAEFSKYIGEDCVANAELVATKYPLESAAFFFDKNNLWVICDKGNTPDVVTTLTKRVNGGILGLADRLKHFNHFYNLIK